MRRAPSLCAPKAVSTQLIPPSRKRTVFRGAQTIDYPHGYDPGHIGPVESFIDLSLRPLTAPRTLLSKNITALPFMHGVIFMQIFRVLIGFEALIFLV